MTKNIVSHDKAQCRECKRVFNLLDDSDSSEWFYGHDCEEGISQ